MRPLGSAGISGGTAAGGRSGGLEQEPRVSAQRVEVRGRGAGTGADPRSQEAPLAAAVRSLGVRGILMITRASAYSIQGSMHCVLLWLKH